jgi:hypothetical protein
MRELFLRVRNRGAQANAGPKPGDSESGMVIVLIKRS